MKNIHIIPTDKPSRLYAKDGNYKLANSTMAIDWYISSAGYKPCNIYITSNEDIKDGDWLLVIDDFETYIHEHKGDNLPTTYCKKIILTTDQDLIKDGVQAIDDEFLVWFVKNPSCEEVEIETFEVEDYVGFAAHTGYPTFHNEYKIIIPKEEFKQLPDVNWESDITNKVWDEDEPKQIKCYCGHTITCDCEPLQETLEEDSDSYELAKKLFEEIYGYKPQIIEGNIQHEVKVAALQKGMVYGSKWHQKRMYSKEQLKEAFLQGQESIGRDEIEGFQKTQPFEEWFEQFKKK
jgi:hypothetical protein